MASTPASFIKKSQQQYLENHSMLFNSYIFLFIFLPITWLLFHLACKKKVLDVAIVILVASSLIFYSYWNPPYVLLVLISIAFNYSWGRILEATDRYKKTFLTFGVSINLLTIAYFKYFNFFIENIENIIKTNLSSINIFLPLGISFFTFQQIAYLIDCYHGKTREDKFIHYVLFVTFFPQLIAGPIVRYEQIMPQFKKLRTYGLSYKNLFIGITLLSLGLFKKTVIADAFSPWASAIFDSSQSPTVIEAWGGSLSYTFQIYFDFSGYTDMALGLAKIFNIDLPINFNSPYKSSSIIEFWKRWHISLSLFFRDYLYIPLGGNKKGKIRQYLNIILTMLLCGLWHGASWTFVFWGGLHGIMSCINHFWRYFSQKNNICKLPPLLGWAITFPCIVISWCFFRADTFSKAFDIIKGMFGFNGFFIPDRFVHFDKLKHFLGSFGVIFQKSSPFIFHGYTEVLLILASFLICTLSINSTKYTQNAKKINSLFMAATFFISLIFINNVSEFLYFNF